MSQVIGRSRSMAFDHIYYEKPKSKDIAAEKFSLAVVFNNATNLDICTAIVITRNYLLTTVEGLMTIRANGSKGM